MRQCALVTEPPYTERYVRWCERTASQIMGGLLLDLTLGFVLIQTRKTKLKVNPPPPASLELSDSHKTKKHRFGSLLIGEGAF